MDSKLCLSQLSSLAVKTKSLWAVIDRALAAGQKELPSSLVSTGKTHQECYVQCWSPKNEGDMDLLGQAQQRTRKIVKGLQHLFRLAWRQKSSGGSYPFLEVLDGRVIKKREPHLPRWCPVKGQEAIDANLNTGNFTYK